MDKAKKLNELYDLIDGMDTAMMTTRRADRMLVTRPMATQKRLPGCDLWFVTSIETHKVDEIVANPEVSISYRDSSTMEWVCVSGLATVTQDREKIHELHEDDWRMWFEDEGGKKNGGPDDPRLALIFVDAHSVRYMKAKHGKARTLFELAKGKLTNTQPDLGREETLTRPDLHA